ncbi:MAG: DHH family phosphoesterase [Saprospiraceae bacterium]|nr:DHH family phosphoesterase [Saprospiraceae bacterium]
MTIAEVKSILSMPKRICITSHRNPDGDAIGSSLGLYHYLIQAGHTVSVIFPSDFPLIFSWMPDSDQILISDLELPKVRKVLLEADVIFALDYNALDRIDKTGEIIRPLSQVPKILIDHHREPELFADFMLSDITASSTCELVFDFIHLLNDADKINKTVGECLYTGIVTDTGSFKFATSPKLFRIVANLLERGVEDYRLQDLINNCLPEKNLRLLGHCLANRMEVLPEYKTGIITITKKDYETFDIQRGDTEGIVNYLLSMSDVRLGCLIMEQPTIVKISMRSKGDFNVQEMCRDHFNGGGHKNASGGYSHQGLKFTVEKLKNLLPTYKDKLLNI